MSTGRIVRKEVPTGSTLPIIGKIKVGKKAQTAAGKEYPTSLDYFRVDDQTSKYAELFHKAYGPQPKKIRIIFISNETSQACNEQWEAWGSDGKFHGSGDGETFRIWDANATNGKGEKGAYVEGLPKTDERVKALKDKWAVYLTMNFIIPDIGKVMGQWQFKTKGEKSTIPAIINAFDWVRNQANGNIAGVPFDLSVEKKKGYTPGAVRNYPVVTLVPNLSMESLTMMRDFLSAGGDIGQIVNMQLDENKLKQLAAHAEEAPVTTTEDVEAEEIPTEILKQNPLTPPEVYMPKKEEVKAGSKLDFPE